MKNFYFLTVVFFFAGGLFYVNAQDVISLRDGSTIQAKVLEISPAEIKYKRFDNQNGPTIVIYSASVLSIKYQNGVVDVINTPSPNGGQWLSDQLQATLNSLPAVTVAGNSLKFQFNSDKWTAMLNGENFLTGIIELENTATGSLLSLKQTHMWPSAAAKTAGKVASKVPGAGAVSGAVNTASSVAGAAGLAPGAIEASGPIIVLEYISGPSPKLSFVRTDKAADASGAGMGGGEYIKLENVIFYPNKDPSSTVQFNISTEDIEGSETEVLNIKGSTQGNYSEILTSNYNIIEKIVNGSGIRFKAIGDGKNYYLLLAAGTSNWAFYGADIKTKKNKIVEIDISFSKLRQPSYGRQAKFDKNDINGLHFGMGKVNERPAGNYSIKIFDLEIY